MKIISVTAQQQLLFAELPIPEISADQCLVKVKAIGVNRADILQRQGKYPAPKGDSPILGLEVCGDIVASGHNVTDWPKGEKVFGLVAGGGYAEYAVINARHLFKLPPLFSYQQGAACAETFLTAYQSLFSIAQLNINQSVLIHAGASGVGCAAIALAKAYGCFVVVTAGSNDKCNACIKQGADVAINYHETDFVIWTKKNLPTGFDVIIDVVGGDYVQKNINVSAMDGQIVLLSILQGRFCPEVDLAKMLLKRVTLTASTLRNRSDGYKTELVNCFEKAFGELLQAGKLLPVIDRCYEWQNADSAHQRMLENSNIGKLVLTI